MSLQTFRLGLFIVAGLAILTVGVFLIGGNESLFQRTYRVNATFHNVSGLSEGADVRVGGIHKGTVKHIDLPHDPSGSVTVAMDLARGTRDVVKQDSVASIASEGLVGDKYVEVSFGSPGAQAVRKVYLSNSSAADRHFRPSQARPIRLWTLPRRRFRMWRQPPTTWTLSHRRSTKARGQLGLSSTTSPCISKLTGAAASGDRWTWKPFSTTASCCVASSARGDKL